MQVIFAYEIYTHIGHWHMKIIADYDGWLTVWLAGSTTVPPVYVRVLVVVYARS